MYRTQYLYLFLQLLFVGALTYSVPEPKVEILEPRGMRISIPHERGIILVAFHVNIDKPINLNDLGQYSADITEPNNDKWIFDNTRVSIDSNTIVYYWLHVQYGSQAYRKVGKTIPSSTPVDISDPSPGGTTAPVVTSSPVITTDCIPSKTTVNRREVCQGELIFEDNFNNLNLTKWQREVRIPIDSDDFGFVSFQARDENLFTDNGQLHIVPSLLHKIPEFETKIRTGTLDLGVDCTAVNDRAQECRRRAQGFQILPPIVSARIRTMDSFRFQYGKVEVRAKLPKGDWLFPQILLESAENSYGPTGYKSGQMRVAFIRGNKDLEDKDGRNLSGFRIAGGVVLSTGEALRDVYLQGTVQKSHLGDDFHTYTLTWTDEYISVAIDGNEFAYLPGKFAGRPNVPAEQRNYWSRGGYMAPFDKEFFLALGVSAGGHSDFPNTIERKPWKNGDPKAEFNFWNSKDNWITTWNGQNSGLHVDFVRVYAL